MKSDYNHISLIVEEMNLADNTLIGKLPSEIGALSKLSKLDLPLGSCKLECFAVPHLCLAYCL